MLKVRLLLLALVLVLFAAPGFSWTREGHRFIVKMAMSDFSQKATLASYLNNQPRQARVTEMVSWPDGGKQGQNENPMGHSHHMDSSTYDNAVTNVDSSLLCWVNLGKGKPTPPAPATMQEKCLAYVAHYASDLCCPVHVRRGLDRLTREEAKVFHSVPEKFTEWLIQSEGASLVNAVGNKAQAMAPKGVAPTHCSTPAKEVEYDLRYTFDHTSRDFDTRTKYVPPAKLASGKYNWEQWKQPSKNVRALMVRDLARSTLIVRKYWIMSWPKPK